MIMLLLLATLLLEVVPDAESARYARFGESYVPAVGSFASAGNVVYLGAKNKVLKLHFSRRVFIAQFEVLSSTCPPGNESCTDYTQHTIIADGQTFGVNEPRVLVTCGTHGGSPRCLIRDLGLLKSLGEVRGLEYAATSGRHLTSLAEAHDQSFYYASYITNSTSHPILARYSHQSQLTSKLDNKWFNKAQFVSMMPIDEHMYIFFKELTFDLPSPILTSRVARVCLNDRGGNKLLLHKHFRTFTKADITCTSPSFTPGVPDYTYSFIDGVAVPHQTLADVSRQDRRMYAIFSNIPNGPCSASAICAYNLPEVGEAFGSSHFVRVDHGHTTTQHTVNSVSDVCEEPRSLYDAHKYNLLRDPVTQSDGKPLFAAKCRRYIAVAADTSNDIDVLFIATDDQHFLKLAMGKGGAYLVDSFRIRKEDAPITKIEKKPSANYVLASGSDYLLRIPVAQCRRFNDCNACVGARDPYCGWCPIYNACVATVSCPQSITNYEEMFETSNLCYPHQAVKINNTRKAKKIRKKRKKRRK